MSDINQLKSDLHEAAIQSAEFVLPAEDTLISLAELYKIFSDPTRIKILYILSAGEMCVCDMATLVGVSQSGISHQLRLLKQANLIKPRRDGKTVFYSLADDHVRTIINNGIAHVFGSAFPEETVKSNDNETLIKSILENI